MLQPAGENAQTDRLTAAILQIYPRLLGLLFLYTFIQKIRGQESIDTILRFDGFPEYLTSVLRWTVIIVECALALALTSFIYFRRPTLLIAAIVLTIYTAQLVFLLMSKDAPSCGCLENTITYEEAHHTNLMSLIRNICLIIPAVWTYAHLGRGREEPRKHEGTN